MVKTELYDLIQSMTMSEKRYFKIYSSKHVIGDKNDYVDLFDAMDIMEDYDEEFLKKQRFVKNLSAEKNYLQKLVLKSLVAFNSNLNSKMQVIGYLQNAEVLYHKGLYKHAEKQCVKAINLASEYELFTHKIVALELMVELISKQFQYQEAIEKIELVKSEGSRILNFLDIQELTMCAYRDQWEIGAARSDSETKTLSRYIDQLSEIEYDPKSVRARMYVLGLNLTYAFYLNDVEKMISYSLEMNDLYDNNENIIEYSTIGYISSLYNTGWGYTLAGDYEKALAFAQKLNALSDRFNVATSFNKSARIFFYSNLINFECLLKMDKYAELDKLIIDTEKGIETYSKYIGEVHLYELYFQIAKYYFVIANYKMSLKYTNLILNDTKFKNRKDLLSVVRLLNLLVHYELGNDFTLEYLTKNTFNYFKSKNRLFKVEKELISFISGRNKDLQNEKIKEDLIQLRDAMKEHKKDSFEASPFNFFDFEYWAMSKIEGEQLTSYSKD